MAHFHVQKTKSGEFRFELIANNGETIAVSETYKLKAKAMKAIDTIKSIAKAAKVVDGTVPVKAAPAKPVVKPAVKKVVKKAALKAVGHKSKFAILISKPPAARPVTQKEVAAKPKASKPAPVIAAPTMPSATPPSEPTAT